MGARGGVTVEFATAERISLAVAVTAQDGRTQQYVLDVRRAPPDANADLGSLTASAGVLSPIFSPRVISYAVSLRASRRQREADRHRRERGRRGGRWRDRRQARPRPRRSR